MARKPHVKVSEILELVPRDYRRQGLRSVGAVKIHIKRLLPEFGERAAIMVTKKHVNDYIDKRQAEGAANATINRELAVLKRAFNLAVEEETLDHKPKIPKLEEADPREDFFEYDEFRKLEAALRARGKRSNYDGDVVADVIVFAYFSGWRLSEVLQLHKSWIKADLRIAVLPASKHKNKKPKICPLEGEVWDLVEKHLAGVNGEGYLFHRSGRRVKSVRKICLAVCSELKFEDKDRFRFHALRRSFVTNVNRANIPDRTGMQLSGHLTQEVYGKYNQVTLDQLREAVCKVNTHLGIDKKPLTEKIKKDLTTADTVVISGSVNDREQLTEEQVTVKKFKSPELLKKVGGEGGIRTPETRQGLPDFESNSLVQPINKPGLFRTLSRVITKLFEGKGEDHDNNS